MLKFKRVSKEWISKNAESLLAFGYERVNHRFKELTYIEIADGYGITWTQKVGYLPYDSLHSLTGVDRYGGSWIWISKTEPDCLYLLEYAPKHPLEQDEPVVPPTPKKDPIPYYTYEPDYIVLNDQSIVFPVIRIVDDSFPEGEFKTLAESGMLFTDMKKLGEHFETHSRTYVYHPWVQSAADFRLNQKSE